MKNQFKNKRAFTLIELLIVIAIIGILFIVLVSKVDFATDKAKATGVQTDFRSFQMAFDTVAKENAGFNTFGFDTGDNAGTIPTGYEFVNEDAKKATMGDGIRNSYDEGDKNLNGKQDVNGKDGYTGTTEVFTGRKIYTEKWTDVWTLVKPGTSGYDADAIFALGSAINKNLDPKLHITIAADGKITMANQARDPWKNEYHGYYITNAETDKGDRGAIVIYSNGANGKWGSAHIIENGIVTVGVPGNNVDGKDDYSIVSCYTYLNGFGEVLNITTGFSSNQTMSGSSNTPQVSIPGDDQGSSETPDDVAVAGATFTDGVTLSWEELMLTENGNKYGYKASSVKNDSVDVNAFNGCKTLAQIVIPDSVEIIDSSAFSDCTSLEILDIGNGVSTIRSSAFLNCSNLKEIYYNATLCTLDSYNYPFSNSGHVNGCKVVIGNNVLCIPERLFGNLYTLQSVEFQSSSRCQSIGKLAFSYCYNLTSITIPDSIIDIGNDAFTKCTSMQEIYFNATEMNDPDSEPFKNIGSNGVEITLTIGKNVTQIPANCFANANNITTVVFEEDWICNRIGSNAFSNSGCKKLYISNISSWCHVLFESIHTPMSAQDVYIDNVLVKDLVIPNNTSYINPYAFYGSKFNSVTIGGGVSYIDNKAFCNAKMTTVVISDEVAEIGSNAFKYCTNLQTLTIGDGVQHIGEYAFSNCSKLSVVNIGNGLKTVGFNAFESCNAIKGVYIKDIGSWCGIEFEVTYSNPAYFAKKLYCNNELVTDLVIPEGVTKIGAYTFAYNQSITKIIFANSVTSIGENAFYQCKSLKTVSFGSNLQNIGVHAFGFSARISNVTFNGTKESWNMINKGENWNYLNYAEKSISYVACSDGSVSA